MEKKTDFVDIKLAKPAQRALANAGIDSLKKLASFSKKEIEALHGIGQNAMVALSAALKKNGLSFSTGRK